MSILPFPSRPIIDGDDFRLLTAEELAVIAPAPFWHVTAAQAAFIEAERDRSRGVIVWLVCAAIFTTGAFCGIVAVGGVALGWW